MKYIIGSGWWCAGDNRDDGAELIGHDLIRGVNFHRLWYRELPLGFSRARPLDLNEKYFYFQHAGKQEIEAYLKLTGFDLKW